MTDSRNVLVDAEAILLDMDGTLINSEKSVVESWNRLFQELGTDLTYVSSFHGIPGRTLLRTVLPTLSERDIDKAFAQVEDYEIATASEVDVLAGVPEFLASLEEVEAELGRPVWTIVTSCTRGLFEARFGGTGLRIPETTVTADQVKNGKPHPEPYLTGAARLGVDPAQCIVVEDAIPGITAGKEAGCITVGVATTTTPSLIAAHADFAIGTLATVVAQAHDGRVALVSREV